VARVFCRQGDRIHGGKLPLAKNEWGNTRTDEEEPTNDVDADLETALSLEEIGANWRATTRQMEREEMDTRSSRL
jgi:hypothetical protein